MPTGSWNHPHESRITTGHIIFDSFRQGNSWKYRDYAQNPSMSEMAWLQQLRISLRFMRAQSSLDLRDSDCHDQPLRSET
jgi:hypothetical protein